MTALRHSNLYTLTLQLLKRESVCEIDLFLCRLTILNTVTLANLIRTHGWLTYRVSRLLLVNADGSHLTRNDPKSKISIFLGPWDLDFWFDYEKLCFWPWPPKHSSISKTGRFPIKDCYHILAMREFLELALQHHFNKCSKCPPSSSMHLANLFLTLTSGVRRTSVLQKWKARGWFPCLLSNVGQIEIARNSFFRQKKQLS